MPIVVQGTINITPAVSSIMSNMEAITAATTSWWAINPLDPTMNTELNVTAYSGSVTEASAVHKPLGDTRFVVVADTVGGDDGTLTIQTFDTTTYNAVVAISTSQAVWWLTSPFGFGEYVRFGPMPGGMSSGMGNRVRNSTMKASSVSTPNRSISMTYVGVYPPIGQPV